MSLRSKRNRFHFEKLLRNFIKESLQTAGNSPELLTIVNKDQNSLKEKWSVLDEYFGARGRLTESRKIIVENLLSKAWNGLKSMVSYFGKQAIDGAKWVAKNAKSMSKETFEVMKKLGGKLQDAIVYGIKLLPGGEIVLEFLSEFASNLKERIVEMQKAIGKKIEEFIKTAKEKILTFFIEKVLKDPEMKKDFYDALGIDPSKKKQESFQRRRRKNMLSESLLLEAESLTNDPKVMSVLQAAEKGIDADKLREKASEQVGKLVDFWIRLVEKNPQRYHKPLYNSGLFDTLGETGFGLAGAAMLGILGSASLGWEELVRLVTQLIRGFKSGLSRPEGSTSNRAGAFLFLGNQGNNYDSTLFKQFITGIIKGSNLEVIARAMAGDVTQLPEIAKRLIGTIVNMVKTKVTEATRAILQNNNIEIASEETEEEVADEIGKFFVAVTHLGGE